MNRKQIVHKNAGTNFDTNDELNKRTNIYYPLCVDLDKDSVLTSLLLQ